MTENAKLIEKTCVMLTLQDEMNTRVNADWRTRGREWHRAIWIECAELMDHYGGWKWWKHSTPDLPQAVLEIVDIWHFGLSMRLEQGGAADVRDIAAGVVAEWPGAPVTCEFLAEVERLASGALTAREFRVDAIANLLHACDHGFDDLYRTYVAKNVLNLFRQDHGYKTGEYQKSWNGREDNEVLADLMTTLDSERADYRAEITVALSARYAEVVAASGG